MTRTRRNNNGETAALFAICALIIVFAIVCWALLIAGLAWGIINLVNNGPSFWNLAAIIVCGGAIVIDFGRRILGRS